MLAVCMGSMVCAPFIHSIHFQGPAMIASSVLLLSMAVRLASSVCKVKQPADSVKVQSHLQQGWLEEI